MNYNQLVEFLTNKMSMSHVYQPVVIRSLVDAGGVATLRQLAQTFLLHDERLSESSAMGGVGRLSTICQRLAAWHHRCRDSADANVSLPKSSGLGKQRALDVGPLE